MGSSNMDHHGSNIDICIPLLRPGIPATKKEVASLSGNLKSMVTPLFIFMCVCMTLTAISEFGPTQWAQLVLAKSGAEPMVILALITGLMAVGRYFGGEFVHKFDQTGVLLGSAIFTTIGIFLCSARRPERWPMLQQSFLQWEFVISGLT